MGCYKKSNVKFAYIKRSEGTGYTDSLFEKHSRDAQTYGVLWGAYHYYYFDADPIDQAQNFYNLLPKDTAMITPAVDIELSDSGTLPKPTEGASALNKFSDEFLRLSGVSPVFYVTSDSYNKYLSDVKVPNKLWYRSTFGHPEVKNWTIWQYSDKGIFGKSKGYIDRNAFAGSSDDLDKMIVKFGNSK